MTAITRVETGSDRMIASFRDCWGLSAPQWAAILAMYDHPQARVLMGGAGYGGKSRNLRMAAFHFSLWLTHHGHSRAGFRQKLWFGSLTKESLRDRHLDKFEQEFGAYGRQVTNKTYGLCWMWQDPAMPVIIFRNMETRERKGSENAAGFYDELTEATRTRFGDLEYQCRMPGIPFNPIVTASNPDGPGFHWVKELWQPHAPEYQWPLEDPLVFQSMARRESDAMGVIDPTAYYYVPFLPTSNPAYNEKVFLSLIANLPVHIQNARRYGQWITPEGARWPQISSETHGFMPHDVWHAGLPEGWRKVLCIDYGLADPYAAVWYAIDYDGNPWVYRVLKKAGLTADFQAEEIADAMGQNEVLSAIFADPMVFAKEQGHFGETDLTISSMYLEAWRGDRRFACGIQPWPKPRRAAKWVVLDRYANEGNRWPDLKISMECKPLWDEIQGAVWHRNPSTPEKAEDIDDSCDDHVLDALVGGLLGEHKAAKRTGDDLVAQQEAAMQARQMERMKRQALRKLQTR